MTATFLDLVDLASERLGGAVVAANDEFFAPKENLISAGRRRCGAKASTPSAANGWTAGRRAAGATRGDHDWCIVRLGVARRRARRRRRHGVFQRQLPGVVRDRRVRPVRLPTADELCARRGARSCRGRRSTGDSHNLIASTGAPRATHLRLRIFPDGGVARLRVYGDVVADWDRLRQRGDVDLAAVEHGGLVVACSDMFFGSRHNLIMPGDATHMGDGWETKRRRGPGHDWTIVRLGDRGHDPTGGSRHAPFQGQRAGRLQPGRRGRRAAGATSPGRSGGDLLPRTAAPAAYAATPSKTTCGALGDVTHVRFNIFPDGGVGRLRLFGRPR